MRAIPAAEIVAGLRQCRERNEAEVARAEAARRSLAASEPEEREPEAPPKPATARIGVPFLRNVERPTPSFLGWLASLSNSSDALGDLQARISGGNRPVLSVALDFDLVVKLVSDGAR